jgi:hypothetical protein
MCIETRHVDQPKSPRAERPLTEIEPALSAALQRECIQDLAVQLAGWGNLAARAASVSSAEELLGVLRGARKTLLVALDEAKELVAIEGGGDAA